MDDDENFRTWLALLMRRTGFQVVMAEDGAEALAKLRETSYDLLLCDLEMPKMSGLDVIDEIRASAALSGQYAVMITSHEDVDSKVTALTSGYDDFLPKSCTEAEVIAKVVAAKRMLARQRLLSAAAREWQVLATRDELTGIPVRRTFYDAAERYLAEGTPIGVAIIDLDAFKPVNDTYGHLTGDRILRDIGALFQSRTRSEDLIARYGGDEFLLLVAGPSLEEVTHAADRLIGEIAALQWQRGDVTIVITATSGVAHSSLLPETTIERLLDAADRDLYAKKWAKKSRSAAAVAPAVDRREAAPPQSTAVAAPPQS